MRKTISPFFPILSLILLLGCLSCKFTRQAGYDELLTDPDDVLQSNYLLGICMDSLYMTDHTIHNGDNLSVIYNRLGFSALHAEKIIKAGSAVLDPSKLRAGMHYTTFCTNDSINEIKYIAFAKSRVDYAVLDLTGDSITAYESSKDITLKRYYTEGILNSSLWNTLKAGGTDPLLALKLSDVFAWQIDFFDVKEGDSFRILYDVAYIDDTTAINIAAVSAAVFNHKGKDFVAIPFAQDSIPEYFDMEGNSLRKAFLKAPLDFNRITSRFSNSRFHPVLKRYRAHHGVDYAAPVGTPVKTIGDGTVIAKGYESGGGNYVKVKHNSVYTTTYMHLSKFAKGLQVGSHVRQGEVIAYVGSTGLSTGPHLDFRVHKNGKPIDPLSMDAPPSEPVKPELQDSFAIIRQIIYAELDSFRTDYLNRKMIAEVTDNKEDLLVENRITEN